MAPANLQPLTTLKDVQDQVAQDCDTGHASVEERCATDMTTCVGMNWLALNAPEPTTKSHKAFRRHVRDNMARIRDEQSQTDPRYCRFAFLLLILESILGWLVQKAADSTWEWYKRTHNSPRLALEFRTCCLGMQDLDDAVKYVPDSFHMEGAD